MPTTRTHLTALLRTTGTGTRRRRLAAPALAGLALTAGAVTTASPVQAAGPATTVTLEDAWTIRADGTNELAAFVNVARDAFCTDAQIAAENAFAQWLADGAVGDPPDDHPFVAASEPLVVTVQDVARNVVRASGSATVPVELWTFEAGKSWAAGNLAGPCMDTDGLADLTDEHVAPGALLASGAGTYTLRDNSWTGEGPRTNVWSETLTAQVVGDGAQWTYTFTQDNQARDGEYLKGATTFRLKPR